MTLDRDTAAAEKATAQMQRQMKDAVPCPGERQTDGSRKTCGRNCLPGQMFCRIHGGGVEVISRAAAAIRMEAARGLIAQELSEGITLAVGLYLAVVESDLEKTTDRIAAADRLIALAGGKDMLTGGDGEQELTSAQAQLQELLLAASDDRLDRLAARLLPPEQVQETTGERVQASGQAGEDEASPPLALEAGEDVPPEVCDDPTSEVSGGSPLEVSGHLPLEVSGGSHTAGGSAAGEAGEEVSQEVPLDTAGDTTSAGGSPV